MRARSPRFPGPRSRKRSFPRVCANAGARARARESTRGRRTRAMQCGMYPGLWNAARGRDAANIPARTRAILRTGRRGDKVGPRYSRTGGGSLTGGRRSGKLRPKLITSRLAGTTGVRSSRRIAARFYAPPRNILGTPIETRGKGCFREQN